MSEIEIPENVAFAFTWAFFIAGAGQAYNGQWSKAILVFICIESFSLLTAFMYLIHAPMIIIIGLLATLITWWIGGVIDAVCTANKQNGVENNRTISFKE